MKNIYLSLAAIFIFGASAPQETAYVLNPAKSVETISVKDAINLALSNNLSLKKIDNKRREAQNKVRSTASHIVPDLSLQSSYRVTPEPSDAKVELQLEVPLIDAKSWAALKASRESLAAAEHTLNYERDKLSYQVANLYGQAFMARSLRDVVTEELEHYKKQVLSFENKFRIGTVRSLDVLDAQFQLSRSQNDLIIKELEYQHRLGDLGSELQRFESFDLLLFDVQSVHLNKNQESLLALALDTPEIHALKKEISSWDSSITSDRFSFLPRIFGSVESGWQQRSAHDVKDQGGPFFTTIMLNLKWPLINLENSAQIRLSHVRRSTSELTLAQKTAEKRLSINGVLTQIKAYENSLISSERMLEISTKASASTERLFSFGEATGLMVMDANVKLFKAKSQLIEDKINLVLSKLRLLFLIGKISEF